MTFLGQMRAPHPAYTKAGRSATTVRAATSRRTVLPSGSALSVDSGSTFQPAFLFDPILLCSCMIGIVYAVGALCDLMVTMCAETKKKKYLKEKEKPAYALLQTYEVVLNFDENKTIMIMKQYYHVSSKALEKNDIFHSREDFVTAMNDVALCVLKYDVMILCFCLMSNHFHFVLKGNYQDCYSFVNEFKRICAIRMRDRSGEVAGLKDVDIHFDLLDSQQYIENAIAYVLRNPMAARIIAMPYFYEWSSILAYFRGHTSVPGTPLKSISIRKRRELLRTRHDFVPDFYVLSGDGYVHPACYVASEEVEKIFRHPSRLLMALAKRIENEFEVTSGAANQIVMLDSELKTHVLELISNEFGVNSLAQLSADDRLRLCLMVRRNFNASVKQIARVLRISQSLVASVL